ncbi:hypothetical protein C5167_034373 [Papaver somniferum]|uniref:Uncharacterized protein n=1 Tax=Papaver somniferum TaxID=3469 RepID=A0A4Y7KE46_PAPSO|nr:hypothetical protein C5167_034373 [Papaver somniferum]
MAGDINTILTNLAKQMSEEVAGIRGLISNVMFVGANVHGESSNRVSEPRVYVETQKRLIPIYTSHALDGHRCTSTLVITIGDTTQKRCLKSQC